MSPTLPMPQASSFGTRGYLCLGPLPLVASGDSPPSNANWTLADTEQLMDLSIRVLQERKRFALRLPG
jgi:hypothetical protein